MSELLSIIPFGEIFPEATVRVALIEGVQYLSVRDFIMAVCGQTGDRATKTWRNLSDKFKVEVGHFQFPGRGQQAQPVIRANNISKLLTCLPGSTAKEFRLHADSLEHSLSSDSDTSLRGLSEVRININQKRKRNAATCLPTESFVYAVRSESFPDVIKIGKADDIARRLIGLNTSMPEHEYKLVASFGSFNAMECERDVHRHFADRRTIKEFFRVTTLEIQPYFTKRQRDHLELKFQLLVDIRTNLAKKTAFFAWVTNHQTHNHNKK